LLHKKSFWNLMSECLQLLMNAELHIGDQDEMRCLIICWSLFIELTVHFIVNYKRCLKPSSCKGSWLNLKGSFMTD